MVSIKLYYLEQEIKHHCLFTNKKIARRVFWRCFENLERRCARYEQIRANYTKKFCAKRADAQSRGEKMTVAWVMASETKRELRSAVSNHREGTLPGNSSLSTKSLPYVPNLTNFRFRINRF